MSAPVARPFPAAALALLLCTGPAPPEAGAQESRVLGHEAYEIWATIGSRALAPDGRWALHTLQFENDDGALVVREVDSERTHRIERGASAAFTADGSRVVFTIRPARDARERGAGSSSEPPRDTLGVLELESGEVTRIPRVRAWRLPDESAEWLVYHLHPETSDEDGEDGPLVLRSLSTGDERRLPRVDAFDVDDGARLLAFVQAPAAGDGSTAVRVVEPGQDGVRTVLEAPGAVRNLVVDGEGRQVAFLHARDAGSEEGEDEGEEAEHVLFRWTGTAEARAVADAGAEGIPDGWWVSRHGSVSFSRDGGRLYFGTAPRPPGPPQWDHPLDEEVDVEVWHYRDEELMTVQRVREDRERRRSYQAVYHAGTGRIVQLADEALPSVSVGADGEAALGVGTDSSPYGIMNAWESPSFRDVYLVDVETGERERVVEGGQSSASLSPEGSFLYWYEPGDSAWFAREIATGEVRNVSAVIPHPVHNELHDAPRPAGSYGSDGWTEGDGRLLLRDRYDVWAVDPRGEASPRAVTGGAGRERGLRFRIVRLDRDARAFSPDETLLLSAFDEATKEAGFYRTALDGTGPPDRLIMEARSFSTPVRARDADRLLFTQERFEEFPDLWVADPDFASRTRVSRANPQQEEYRWGTAELVEWTSTDGIPLQGVLMKPDDFDPEREYPLVVYFYERWSDRLHAHYAPVPHRSRIAFPMYTSHDYLVFIPDIAYRVGYPGESGYNAVVPGVLHLLDRGIVDRDRIALQGHSWGGYQIAFIVTRSGELFRAAAAGAPVANMTSAYGGIRWETGLVRQFQYERTQSRLGGSLWDVPVRYLENSPLFWVDKIETPLLIMHNNEDGHVPWEQGIELFVAMKRLGKPAWMINYVDEPHWPTTFANRRDWNIRMKQFFDHFLQDAAPPAWMVEGIPAVRRDETLGYEPVEGASVDRDGGGR